MVKIDNNSHPNQNQSQTDQDKNCGFETQLNNQTQSNQKPQSGLMTIIGQLLPLAPFAFEQFTGQKVPQMTGTIAEMQMALINIQTNLQTVVNNQQSLNQRLIQLETKLSETQTQANQHLTNLTQQFQSLRLTHTREKKQIEYNNPSRIEEEME